MVVIAPTPLRALRDAGTVVALLAGLSSVALLVLSVGIDDAVAPPVSPYDDGPWLALNPPEISSGAFENATGMTPEAVISQFGPPMRVRRDRLLPEGCSQSYIYATRVDGQRTTTGLCFTAEGRVASFVGQTLEFDLGRMIGDPRDAFADAAITSLLLGLPLAAILAVRRRLYPVRCASLGLPGHGAFLRAPSNNRMHQTVGAPPPVGAPTAGDAERSADVVVLKSHRLES